VSTGTGSSSYDAGTALLTSNGSSNRAALRQQITCVVGQNYKVNFEVTATTGGDGTVIVDKDSFFGGGDYAAVVSTAGVSAGATFRATQTSHWVFVYSTVASNSVNADNVSVKQITLNTGA